MSAPRQSDPHELREEYKRGYEDGYAAGKSKAHFEVRNRQGGDGHDINVCGCEPCITVRTVLSNTAAGFAEIMGIDPVLSECMAEGCENQTTSFFCPEHPQGVPR